ncbi:MAG: dienelactone hydrolase family protein [Pirellulaceae bacterium]
MRSSFLARGCGFLTCYLGILGCDASINAADDVPWLEDSQRAPQTVPAPSPQLSPLLVGTNGAPIDDLAAWQLRRADLQCWWREFLGSMGLERSPVPQLEILSEDHADGIIRQRVRYEVEPGISTEAYLLKPANAAGAPGVAVFHSTVNPSIRQPAGVEGKPEKAFGWKLAQRGYVVFCPRNYLWPDNHRIAARDEARRFAERRPDVKGMAKMLWDAQVAVDILARLPEVDGNRLGAVGHSLGAKEVLYLAALDERIKVTVSSEGGVGTQFSNWDAPWYLGPSIKEPSFAHEHHELLALVAPRPFLLIAGDSADGDRSWPFIAEAMAVYRLYGPRPRIGLFNHKRGHSVPPQAEQRIYEWFETYLPVRP